MDQDDTVVTSKEAVLQRRRRETVLCARGREREGTYLVNVKLYCAECASAVSREPAPMSKGRR